MANKLNLDHTGCQKQKMKVKLLAQTLSTSLADSLEFLEYEFKHPKFNSCSSSIEFVRNIDRRFYFLNWSHAFAKGFKAPTSNFNLSMQENIILSICKYLLKLRNTSNHLLNKGNVLAFEAGTQSSIFWGW